MMSFADMTATAECEEEGVVMSYFLFGTPTPTYTPVGGLPSPTPELGDALNGQALFNTDAACFSCHSVNPAEWLVGPSLSGIPKRAGERIENLSARDYLRLIIRDPSRITPSSIPGIMPTTYAQTLTDQQIEDIVAYLMTLEY
jgi:nitric oxide reductase subunit C